MAGYAPTFDRKISPPSPGSVPSKGTSVVGVAAAIAVGATPAIALAIIVGDQGTKNPWVLPLALLTLTANLLIILTDIRYGLAMFLLAAGLSPKLPGAYDNLRVEDFVFVLVFGIWCLRALQSGGFPKPKSPIVQPFIALTIMSVASTIWGFVLGTIPDVTYAIFLQLKRVEYFLIFVVAASTIRTVFWLNVITVVFVISGALAGLYGLTNREEDTSQQVTDVRVSGPAGENYNTLSGYLVICIGLGLAAIPHFRKPATRFLLLGCTALMCLALLLSFSREGYIMLAGSLLVFGLTREHRGILIGAVFAAVLIFVVAEPVRKNVERTTVTIAESQSGDVGGNSMAARYAAWEYRWNHFFLKQPVIGSGVGSVALSVDNEYLLRLCEVGVIGFAIFAWWLRAIWLHIRKLLRGRELSQKLAVGLAAGFVGMLIQGLVATSFTTIRTMEPFWFLLGLVSAAANVEHAARQKPSPARQTAREPAE